MGLSSKQVSGDGFDWTQCLLQSGAGGIEFSNNPPLMKQQEQQQQQQEQQQLTPLNCPRCDSTNTKFCYYNNYNRSQPRHFCRSCKRHWTKGGTLRNVPIGGGRKNKHLKTTTNTSTTKTGKKISKFLNQSLISPTLSTHLGSSDLCPSSMPSFQFTSLNNFGNHPSSGLSFSLTGRPQSTNGFDDSDQIRENLSYSSYGNPTTMFMAKEWQVQSTNDFMNSSINWSWEDMSTFITTDLMHPLEVDQIKQ